MFFSFVAAGASFLRRVSVGSCGSVPATVGKKTVQDATNPSPCDVAAFVPITPNHSFTEGGGGLSALAEPPGRLAGGRGGNDAPMSPVSGSGGGIDVPVGTGAQGGGGSRGRFATDFQVMEVIGTGSFGTVYKVRRDGGRGREGRLGRSLLSFFADLCVV